MKNAAIVCLFLAQGLFGQKPSESEARQLFENTLRCLRSGDTTGFVRLWIIDGEASEGRSRVCVQDLRAHFAEMRSFLDTAITRSYRIDEVEVDDECGDVRTRQESSHCNYSIAMWFKYSERRTKGITVEVKKIGKKWYYLFAPDYTIIQS